MYCPKCGHKVLSTAKFCPQCGQALEPKTESKPAAEAPTGQQPKPKTTLGGCLAAFIILSIIGGIVAEAIVTPAEKAKLPANFFMYFISIPLLILILWLVVWLIYRWVKGFKTHKVRFWVVFGFLAAGLVGGYLWVNSFFTQRILASYDGLQSALTDILYVKNVGDDAAAGKVETDWAALHDQATKAVAVIGGITLPDQFENYYNTISEFATQICDASSSAGAWASRPDVPSVTADISGNLADKLFWRAVDKIVAQKDYGDWAILKKDTDLMRLVAARIEAESIAMSKLIVSEKPQKLVLAQVGIFKPHPIPTGHCRGIMPCGHTAQQKIPPTYQSAHRWTAEPAETSETWNSAWSDLGQIITMDNGYSIGGAGITDETKLAAAESPMMQEFVNECTAKGGAINNDTVRMRMPTSASGNNCNYPVGGQTCWDFMSRDGGRYMGGGSGCPEENLIPKPIEAPTIPVIINNIITLPNIVPDVINNFIGITPGPTSPPNNPSSSFDGTYSITYGAGQCSSNIGVGVLPSGYFNQAFGYLDSSSFTVSNNSIPDMQGGYSSIDASGSVTVGLTVSQGATASAYQTFHFVHTADGGATVSGTLSVTSSYGGVGISCSQTFSGARQ